VDLERVDRITAGAVGEPGSRTFYLQLRAGPEIVSVILEKQQLQLLASSVDELLSQLDRPTDEPPDAEGLDLEEPIDPAWRVGRLSLGYHEDLDLVLLEAEELVPAEEQQGDDPEVGLGALEAEAGAGEPAIVAPEPNPNARRIRAWASREQMLGLARHGATVVASGRPLCQFCGNPLDPSGHVCPAMNGHGSPVA
jgi:uncharacterized repeat protein (TIGR03847 family)